MKLKSLILLKNNTKELLVRDLKKFTKNKFMLTLLKNKNKTKIIIINNNLCNSNTKKS